MSRSRPRTTSQRLSQFEARSVQLIAACTLGLAGMASAQTGPPARQASSSSPSSSSSSVPAPRQAQLPRIARLDATDNTSPRISRSERR
ncbi:hypothetical protein [Hydrogenophaga palleronii]|uniref:hypothetical protein n=1 Tax=Hydrogenophaga palleronii TaxID=65655 RepID=UPI0008260145|nr:hypothetical protein [Hydrogenophaga palleronii]